MFVIIYNINYEHDGIKNILKAVIPGYLYYVIIVIMLRKLFGPLEVCISAII